MVRRESPQASQYRSKISWLDNLDKFVQKIQEGIGLAEEKHVAFFGRLAEHVERHMEGERQKEAESVGPNQISKESPLYDYVASRALRIKRGVVFLEGDLRGEDFFWRKQGVCTVLRRDDKSELDVCELRVLGRREWIRPIRSDKIKVPFSREEDEAVDQILTYGYAVFSRKFGWDQKKWNLANEKYVREESKSLQLPIGYLNGVPRIVYHPNLLRERKTENRMKFGSLQEK